MLVSSAVWLRGYLLHKKMKMKQKKKIWEHFTNVREKSIAIQLACSHLLHWLR